MGIFGRLFGSGSHRAAETPPEGKILGPAEFTTLTASVVREQDPALEFTVPGELRLAFDIGEAHLKNVYKQYLERPQQRDSIVAKHVSSLILALRSQEHAASATADQLLMRVWTQSLVTRSAELVYEPINEELFAVYEFNLPNSIKAATKEEIEALGLNAESRKRTALSNIDRIYSGSNSTLLYQPRPPRWLEVEATGDMNYFISSLPLLDRFYNAWKDVFSGDIVLFLPSRRKLILADSDSQESVDEAAQIAATTFETSPYPLTPNGFVRKDDGWQRLQDCAAGRS